MEKQHMPSKDWKSLGAPPQGLAARPPSVHRHGTGAFAPWGKAARSSEVLDDRRKVSPE